MEIQEPGCHRYMESGKMYLYVPYPWSEGSQCKNKDKRYRVWSLGPCKPFIVTVSIQNIENNSDWRQLQLLPVRLCERWRGRSWATGTDWGGGRDPGSLTHFLSHSLSLALQRMKEFHISDTVCNVGSEIFRMQRAEGCGQSPSPSVLQH